MKPYVGIPPLDSSKSLRPIGLILAGLATVGCPEGEVGRDTENTFTLGSSDTTTDNPISTEDGSSGDGDGDPGDGDGDGDGDPSGDGDGDGDGETGDLCGNGALDPGEACDTGELGGATCESEGFGGGGLTCASDCTIDTSQCTLCGNDMIDDAEECDGANLGDNATCMDLNLGTAMEALSCNPDCTYNFDLCSGCGDGVITDPEECEPAGELLIKDELGDGTCMTEGFDNGELSCSPGCTYDTLNCYSCGDAIQQGVEECDGADFAALTCADFLSVSMAPFDSGSLTCVDDCTIDTDNCSLCGDGVVTGAEICEPGVLGNETCGTQGFDGGVLSCNNDCSGYDTGECTDCGDGLVEGNEQCDGNNLAGQSCNGLGFLGGGNLSCTNACTFNTSMCSNEFCGDGVRNGNDQCDCGNQGVNCTAAQLGNQTCQTQGFDGGALGCFSPNNCQFNTGGCYECGDGQINPGEQCDGVNLGGQTCVTQGFNGGGTLTCTVGCGFNTSQCISVPNPYNVCVNPNQAINGAGPGINNPSIINVPVGGIITDVNMSINALHTWPGDLQFRLIHNGVTRYVIDRPGVPASTYGCSTANYQVQLDDEGNGGTVENVCAVAAPGIFSPPVRTPNQLLNGFDAGNMTGNWNLVIDDAFPQFDNGTLTQWCLTIAWQ